MSEANKPNAHVQEFLDYYVESQRDLGYAVMLSGPWGAGKTHFIKTYFANRDSKRNRNVRSKFSALDRIFRFRDKNINTSSYIYASLYGLESHEQLRRAMFLAAYPAFSGRGAYVAGSLMQIVVSAKGIDASLKPERLFSLDKNKVIIVDDLERVGFEKHEALGVLNSFVEHGGHKLIIIGNDDAISCNKYIKTKEKVIGQTLTIASDIDSAYKYFLDNLQSERGREFFLHHREAVLNVYGQSGYHNLRALRHSLEQFERILSQLPQEYLNDDSSMEYFLVFYMIFSLEYRSKLIDRDSIDRRNSSLAYAARNLHGQRLGDAEEKSDPFEIMSKKYSGINVRDRLISDPTLLSIIVDGQIKIEEIVQDLQRSHLFRSIKSEPEWRTVWHGIERTDEEFNLATENLIRKFEQREYHQPEIILHVLMMRITLGEMGYINKKKNDIVYENKIYIDEIYNAGHFNQQEPGAKRNRFEMGGGLGLGFEHAGSPEFLELKDYLVAKLNDAYEISREAWAKDLFELLESHPINFAREICFSNNGSNDYIREPVLHKICPKAFFEVVFTLNPNQQRYIFSGLSRRYETDLLLGDLKLERPWIEEVRSNTIKRAESINGISKQRLLYFNRHYLDPILLSQEDQDDDIDAD